MPTRIRYADLCSSPGSTYQAASLHYKTSLVSGGQTSLRLFTYGSAGERRRTLKVLLPAAPSSYQSAPSYQSVPSSYQSVPSKRSSDPRPVTVHNSRIIICHHCLVCDLSRNLRTVSTSPTISHATCMPMDDFPVLGVFGGKGSSSSISAEIPSSHGGVIIPYLRKVVIGASGSTSQTESFEYT